jgi:hypothetical protein
LDRIESVIASVPVSLPKPIELTEELSAASETAAEINETPSIEIEREQLTAAMPALRSLATPPVRATPVASSEIGVPFVPYSPTIIGTQEDINNLPHHRRVQQLVRESFETVIAFEGPIEEERLARLVHNRFGFQRVSEQRKALARELPSPRCPPAQEHARCLPLARPPGPRQLAWLPC